MRDYVSIVYSNERTPLTKYPSELASYLYNRFHMSPDMKLLDVGCGRGEYLNEFTKLGLKCSGIDISESMLLNISHTDISTGEFQYRDSSFDIVFHKSLIEHLPDWNNLMKEARRVLKPGGRVIIMTPDWRSQMKVFFEDPTHIRPYDVASIRDILELSIFKNIESELFYQLPSVWKHRSIRAISSILRTLIPVDIARASKIKFLRWSVELMVLGSGTKSWW